MKILITGAAGFIGSSLISRLLEDGAQILGIDNHNDYYDPELKESRVRKFIDHPNYLHCRFDISDSNRLVHCFKEYKPEYVVNLAAQAGVRYSIENPSTYVQSNIVGFSNIIECSRIFDVKHFVYASSSSVYGANTTMPFSVHSSVNHPLSLYAATKKSNELIAHSYSNIFNLPTTGLRFFTAYGPWGRPDMALFKFTEAILAGKPLTVYNYGMHRRDFTYIDDLTNAITRIIKKPACSNQKWDSNNPDPATSSAPWRIYNIASNRPVQLLDYIKIIEQAIGKKAVIEFLPLQVGDVPDTSADIADLVHDFDFTPQTSVEIGVNRFVEWYLDYYNLAQ